tara:strand:- start:231 stop:1046 length:816 start_codon:yes stop_codon:yes gene_type:complete
MNKVQSDENIVLEIVLDYSLALDKRKKPLTTNQISKILTNEFSFLIKDFDIDLIPNLVKQIRNNKNYLDKNVNWKDSNDLIQHGIKEKWINALYQQSEWVEKTFSHSYKVPALVSNKTCNYFNKTTYEEALSWQYILDNGGLEIDKPIDVFVLGSRFYLRKLFAKLYEVELVVRDLEHHLEYKPWESIPKEKSYIESVSKGIIVPLNYRENPLIKKLGTKSSIIYKLSCLLSDKEYLLPSEQINLINRQTKDRFKLVLPTASDMTNLEVIL